MNYLLNKYGRLPGKKYLKSSQNKNEQCTCYDKHTQTISLVNETPTTDEGRKNRHFMWTDTYIL